MFNISFLDYPTPWQMGFQFPATPIMEGIISVHHEIMTYLIFILIFVYYMLYKALIRFDAKNTDTTYRVRRIHAPLLEFIWTIVPVGILIAIALPSFALLYAMDEFFYHPAITLKVIGRQWYWTYEYPIRFTEYNYIFDSYLINDDDLKEGDIRLLSVDNAVFLPFENPVRIILTASDVIHSWAIPSFGVKMDCIPGRLNQIFLYVKREGTFYGQCSELCGVNHGYMPIMVTTLDSELFWQKMGAIEYNVLKENNFLNMVDLMELFVLNYLYDSQIYASTDTMEQLFYSQCYVDLYVNFLLPSDLGLWISIFNNDIN